MFGKKRAQPQYDQCENPCYDPVQPSFGGIPAYSFAEAVRAVVDAPRPAVGPQLLLLAEEDSIANPEAIPDNVRVVYYASGSKEPAVVSVGY